MSLRFGSSCHRDAIATSTTALETALARTGTFLQLNPGAVVVSMAVALALDATSINDIAVLAQLAAVLGAAPSGSTVRRVLILADARTLARIAQARAGVPGGSPALPVPLDGRCFAIVQQRSVG